MKITVEVLTNRQIENIHDRTLQLLENRGIILHSEHARELFRQHGARVDAERVYIPEALINEAVRTAPPQFLLTARNRGKSIMIGPGHPPALCTSAGVSRIRDRSGTVRDADFNDFRLLQKLAQTSPCLNITTPGALFPAVGDPFEGILMMLYHTLTLTDLPVSGHSENEKNAEAALDLIRIATGCTEEKEYFSLGICNSLSPLAWDKNMLDGIRVYAQRNQPVNISCCAMAGATAPVYLYGAVLEANAEVLAGTAYAQLIRPGVPVVYGTTSSIMDMDSMSLALGTPEYTLISAACAQLAHYYGMPYRSSGGLTDAAELDAQAGMESAANLIFGLAEGVDFMLQGTGIYQSYLSMGFDKWIMDEEILSRLLYLKKGLAEPEDDLAEIFGEAEEEGGFLTIDSTVTGFRKEFYFPALTDRRSAVKKAAEGTGFEDLAWAEVDRREREYVCPKMDAQIKRDLTAYIEKTMRHSLPDW